MSIRTLDGRAIVPVRAEAKEIVRFFLSQIQYVIMHFYLHKGSSTLEEDIGVVPYNGVNQIIYWADALCELAFIAPTYMGKTTLMSHSYFRLL